ncbi:MAG: hypothetical protein KDC48_02220 [Planctomycetes bacterium]|nr:hypothetical protein [Planctomycetota bacterium]
MNAQVVAERARERMLSAEIAAVLQVELASVDAVGVTAPRRRSAWLAAAVVVLGTAIACGVAWLQQRDARLAQEPEPQPSSREWLGKQPQDAEVPPLPSLLLSSLFVSSVVEPVVLPGEGPIRGLAHVDGLVWLARGDALLAFDPASGKVVRQRSLPAGLLGLAADERFLYVLEKDAVTLFDPLALEPMRSLPLPEHEADGPARAICCRGDQVCVAFGRRIVAIDRRSGEVHELPPGPTGMQWLACDGKALWGGEERRIVKLADAGGARPMEAMDLPRTMTVQRGAGVFVGERLLGAFDFTDRAGAPQHVAGYVRLDAMIAAPEECLSIKIHADQQGVKYEVGPKPLKQLARVQLELQRIVQDPRSMIPGPNGKRVLIPIVLQAYPGVRVEDLAAAWDVALAVGFEQVYCPQVEVARRRAASAKGK